MTMLTELLPPSFDDAPDPDVIYSAFADWAKDQGLSLYPHQEESIREVVDPPADGRLSDAEVGILWHADGWWALETPQMPNDALSYSEEVRSTHRALWRSGIETDFVRPGAPITRYRVIVVPCLYPMSEETAAWLHDYAASGGTVVVSYLSGPRRRCSPGADSVPGSFYD